MKTLTLIKQLPLLTIMLTVLITAGCDGLKFMSDMKAKPDDSAIIITPVDDPQLAKMILKPNPNSIQIPRDPFMPITGISGKSTEIKDAKKVEPIRAQFSDLFFIGMVRMDEQSIALLKLGDKKVMLKLNEQYKGYMVKDITTTQVVFSDGQTQITLKRGIKK